MNRKEKLELTWISKGQVSKIEPRILIEDFQISYHAKKKYSDNDLFDNKLIFGDNLLALKALEQKYTSKVKCIYIDPPYNTGSAFEYYDDGLEHSIWLNLMSQRFQLLKNLLTDDGVLFVHLDDNESAYCKVLLDEIFGRKNYVNQIIMATNKSFGFKSTSEGIFKQANHILFYAKNKNLVKLNANALFMEKGYDIAYKWEFYNTHLPETQWKWRQFDQTVAKNLGFASSREAKNSLGDTFETQLGIYAIENAEKVFRTASVSGGALLKRKETIQNSKNDRTQIYRHPNDDMNYQFIGGERVIYYKERLKKIDDILLPGELITDIWLDIPVEGLASEGGVDFPKGKKPEKLIQRILALTTKEGDLVLDSFGGSGTTAAVAHKMKRKWITIEFGEHCHSHVIPRLKNIIDGTELSGVTKSVEWKGGGGFKYYKLAPSLITKDKWNNWIINKDYDANMLAAAVCQHEGFTYSPSAINWWSHGYSTETDFIYITTQTLTEEQLVAMSEEVGGGKTLLIYCSAFKANTLILNEQLINLTIKKIPNSLLSKCEWGKNDYKLNISNLPIDEFKEKTEVISKKKKVKEYDLFSKNNEAD